MAKLAIRGHATRGKEVIEILEMLGGKNIHNYNGTFNECYVIDNNKICTIYRSVAKINGFVIITIEGFLEKFPYKVGDKVQHKGATSCGTVYVIERMKWANNHIEYEIRPLYDYNHTGLVTLCVENLQPYKEETIEKTIKTITIEDFHSNTKEWLIDKLESMSKDDALQTICDLHDELQKLQSKKDIKDSIARNAASGWCRCFKCDKIIRDTNAKCDKDKLITCHQWYDGYRTALLALGDERCQEVYK